jgi:hypothetical protein
MLSINYNASHRFLQPPLTSVLGPNILFSALLLNSHNLVLCVCEENATTRKWVKLVSKSLF